MGNATRKFPGISAFDTIVVDSLLLTGQVASATFVVGTESTNVVNVAVQLKDFAGDDMAVAATLPWYFSSDTGGQVLAAAGSGGAAIGTDGLLIEQLANQSGLVTAEADGDIDINVTDTTTRNMYLVLVLPTGLLQISAVLAFST